MPDHPVKLAGFRFREPSDNADVKMLSDVREYGWHVVGVPDDAEGPGFAFTVGVYLRTLQPEILMMGVPPEPAHRVLNAVAEHLMEGNVIAPGRRCSGFVDGREVIFRPVHSSRFPEYLGCANWFYRFWDDSFPVLQCVWPDLEGRFPHEEGFDARFTGRQVYLSLPRS